MGRIVINKTLEKGISKEQIEKDIETLNNEELFFVAKLNQVQGAKVQLHRLLLMFKDEILKKESKDVN